MTDVLSSKTVRLLLFLSCKATILVLLATGLDAVGHNTPYVTELFAFESAMFAGVAAKNGVDNFIAYRKDVTIATSGYAAPPK